MVAEPSSDEFVLKDEVTTLSPAQLLQRATSFVELGKLAISNSQLNEGRADPARATRYFGYAAVCLLPHRSPSLGLHTGQDSASDHQTLPSVAQDAMDMALPLTLVSVSYSVLFLNFRL